MQEHFVDKTTYSICYYKIIIFAHVLSKPLVLMKQERDGYCTLPLVNKNSWQKNIWQVIVSSIIWFDYVDIYHYRENTTQLNNHIKQNKINKACRICYINSWNTAYLISYWASSFKRVRHLQNASLENLIVQELRLVLAIVLA